MDYLSHYMLDPSLSACLSMLQKTNQGASEGFQEASEGFQEAPGDLQEGPGKLQEAPGGSQEA